MAKRSGKKTEQVTEPEKRERQPGEWANRIVGHAEVPPRELVPNPKNWRKHPKFQRKSMVGVLTEVGWVQDIIVNKRTGNLIDGHLRLELSIEKGMPFVPVKYVDLSQEEEDEILATFDPISALAQTDKTNLAKLVADMTPSDGDMANLLDKIIQKNLDVGKNLDLSDEAAEEALKEMQEENETHEVFTLNEVTVFKTSNEWDLPEIREDMLSDQIPEEVWCIGKPVTNARKTLFLHGANSGSLGEEAKGGVLGFYVDDDRFESVWNDAVNVARRFRRFGWGALITPDFSVWRDDPLPVQLWSTYRARWCARYWQEVGMKVIPSLNWGDSNTYRFVHVGIPKNAPVLSLQCRTSGDKRGKEFFLRGFIHALEELTPKNVIIYGGVDNRAWVEPKLPTDSKIKYHWLTSWTAERFGARNKKGAVTIESKK